MDSGVFFLFVVIACVGAGYFASDIMRLVRDLIEQRRSKHRFFYQGIKDLLENKSDEAVDTFIESLAVNQATFDIHLALANFLRTRGEFDRAIRIHKNLRDQPSMPSDKRFEVECELGRDFLKAGLLDRAEEIFNRLVTQADTPLHVMDRVELSLIELFEDTSDWQRAKAVAQQRFDRSRYVNDSSEAERALALMCQYECELYLSSTSMCDSDASEQLIALLAAAEQHDAKSLRPKLLRFSHYLNEKLFNDALDELESGVDCESCHVKEFAQRSFEALRVLPKAELSRLYNLQLRLYETKPSISGLALIAKIIELLEDGPKAVDFVLAELPRFKNLGATAELLLLVRSRVAVNDQKAYQSVRAVLERLAEEQLNYQCYQCGMSLKNMHWRCPSCKGWSTISQTC